MRQRLFGGAIELELPDGMFSASSLRQIPDHQEVFLHQSFVNTSLILEILEGMSVGTDLMTAGMTHWEDLAADNDALGSELEETSFETGTLICSTYQFHWISFCGRQRVPKFGKDEDAQEVCIWMAVIRATDFDADLVLTLNSLDAEFSKEGGEVFHGALKSLQIKDFGLFIQANSSFDEKK